MSIIYQNAFLFLITIISIAIQLFIISIIFNSKNYKKIFIGAVYLSFINVLVFYFFKNIQHFIIINYIIYLVNLFLVFLFIFKFNFIKIFLSILVLSVNANIIEYISIIILKISYPNIIEDIFKFPNYLNYARFVSVLTLVAEALIIYSIKSKFNLENYNNKKKYVILITLTILTFLFIQPNLSYFENSKINIPISLVIYNLILVFLLLGYGIFNYIKYNELENNKQELEINKLYVDSLETALESLRGFKHDLSNIIQSINGYVMLNNIDALKKFMQQINSEINYINNSTEPLKNKFEKYPAIYGLLLSKLSYAETNNLNFSIVSPGDFSVGKFKMKDFIKIFGILIDNALEAAQTSPKKYVELLISKEVVNNKQCVKILICNTYLGVIDKDKIFEYGFTTKENHSGFGLYQVNKIISKYKDVKIETQIDSMWFSQILSYHI